MYGKCSTWSFCTNAIYIITTIIVILYARCIYTVSTLSPTFSDQWYQEMIWWSKFIFLWCVNIQPVPIHYLKHRHSEIKVIEFFPQNDSNAFKKFLYHAGKPDYDDTIVILRNVWANYSDNKLQAFDNIDHFRKHLNLEANHLATFVPFNSIPSTVKRNMSQIIDGLTDHITSGDSIMGMVFDFSILDENEYLYNAYKDLWGNLDDELGERMAGVDKKAGKSALFHAFFYYGSVLVTALHAAFVPDYFIQVANAKKWSFIHKAYFPYLGLERHYKPGRVHTPLYFAEDYPEQAIPYTQVTIHPGDLMYFSSWHVHQVENVHADRVGFAIGARPAIKSLFKESFRPLWLFNMVIIIPLLVSGLYKKLIIGEENERNPTHKSAKCKGYLPSFNGTLFTRFDFARINGTCHFYERSKDYQAKEILGELKWTDFHPWKTFTTAPGENEPSILG